MEKNTEDIAKYYQNKRKMHKIKLLVVLLFLITISTILIGTYVVLNKKEIINYNETSDIKYKVQLHKNEYYQDEYLSEGIDVISSLINKIDVDFEYNLNFDKERDYIYSYKILAEIKLKEKSKTNLIYENFDEILVKQEKQIKNNKLVIVENLKIDYEDYNNRIKKLIDEYKLSNTESELNMNMYLEIIDKETRKQINKEKLAMSVLIPLNTKTTEIIIKENIKNINGEILINQEQNQNISYILGMGIVIFIASLIVLGILIKYNLDTRSAEKMYEIQLAKILFDYKSYVQKINNKVNYKDYKIIKIDTFKELIEMKEEIQAPILMYTEENKKRTIFMMINGNVLFANVLSAELIRENLIKRNQEKTGGSINEKNQ